MYKAIPTGHWANTSLVVDRRETAANKLRAFLKDLQRKDDLTDGTVLRPGHTLTIRNTET